MQPELIKDIENSELIGTYYHIPIYELHDGYFTCNVWSEKEQRNIELNDCSTENIEENLRVILLENFYQSLTAIEDHYEHKSDFNNPSNNLENLRDAIKTKIKDFLQDL
jgi:hypothetical protein